MKRHAKSVLAVDLGGTKIRAGIVSADFHVHEVKTRATPKRGADKIMNALVGLLMSYPRNVYDRVAVGFAGMITWPDGVVYGAPSLPDAEGLNVRRLLETVLRRPVLVDNDATLWTLGEAVRGAGRNRRIVAGLILGTGVGGGLVIGGRVYRGRHNATEFGHMTVIGGGAKDRHGGPGHLEAYAGGWCIERAFRRRSGKRFTGEQIAAAARRGDRYARAVIRGAAYAVALGATNLYRIVDPDVIIIGGGISRMPGLMAAVRRYVKTLIINPAYLDAGMALAKLGDDAPLIGAALLARQHTH